MAITIYFMRHGETYLNKYERMQGWSNAPLTEYGKAMCTASGRGLSDVKFDAVYTSDLQRTIDTAELILKENRMSSQIKMIAEPAFREIFFGSFEGLPVEMIWPEVIEKSGKTMNDIQPILNTLYEMDPTKDAEDYMSFWLRVERGIVNLLKKHRQTNDTILVVSHGMTIKSMLQGLVPDFNYNGYLDNASVTKVRYENGQFHLDSINDISHFKK